MAGRHSIGSVFDGGHPLSFLHSGARRSAHFHRAGCGGHSSNARSAHRLALGQRRLARLGRKIPSPLVGSASRGGWSGRRLRRALRLVRACGDVAGRGGIGRNFAGQPENQTRLLSLRRITGPKSLNFQIKREGKL